MTICLAGTTNGYKKHEVSQLVKAIVILRVAMSIICPLVLYFFDAIIVKGCVLNPAVLTCLQSEQDGALYGSLALKSPKFVCLWTQIPLAILPKTFENLPYFKFYLKKKMPSSLWSYVDLQ